MSDEKQVQPDTLIPLVCPEHGQFEIPAGKMSSDAHRKAPRTGEYVCLIVAPKTRRGTLGEAIIEYGRLEYLFELDPRFEEQLPAFYVAEGDVEPCARPTDDEVNAINALVKGGS